MTTPSLPRDEGEASRKEFEQRAAKEKIDAALNRTRPKTLTQGVVKGVGNILGGALGAAGIAVVTPFVSASAGSKKWGIIGGVFGFTGGLVAGAVGAVTVAVGSVASGVTSIVRGVMAVPGQLTQPWLGNYWDEIDGKWVSSNLVEDGRKLKRIPTNDDDILGKARKKLDVEAETSTRILRDVKDTTYYDALEIGPTAEVHVIKGQYYKLARKYHPDKAEDGHEEDTASKFALISEAYQVLSDEELRKEYDIHGMDGLSGDRTERSSKEKIDASLLYTFLFGSDKFSSIFGTLAVATSASIGDDAYGITIGDARKLQKRRCTRVAIHLVENLTPFVNRNADQAKLMWTTKAEVLALASYGGELLDVVGKAYTLAAAQFLGSLDSGIGMPSIFEWAESCRASSIRKETERKARMDVTVATCNVAEANMNVIEENSPESEEEATNAIFKLMWATTVIDVTNTIHEACQMVFFDKSVDSATKRLRAEGVKALGEIFIETALSNSSRMCSSEKEMYENAAFAAMLETVARKEEASFDAKRL